MDAAHNFHQPHLRFTDPIQFDYEAIRPILLEDQTIAERSRQTEVERTVLGDKARRFVQDGMLGLVDQRAGKAGRKDHVFPPPVARYILHVKQMYPPIHYRGLVRIVERKFGYTTNHHTIKRFLDQHPRATLHGRDHLLQSDNRKLPELDIRQAAVYTCGVE